MINLSNLFEGYKDILNLIEKYFPINKTSDFVKLEMVWWNCKPGARIDDVKREACLYALKNNCEVRVISNDSIYTFSPKDIISSCHESLTGKE